MANIISVGGSKKPSSSLVSTLTAEAAHVRSGKTFIGKNNRETQTGTMGNATVITPTGKSATATVTGLTYTYNSSNDNFTVAHSAQASATVSVQPSVNTAGYISSSEGTKTANNVTAYGQVAATVAKVGTGVDITGTTTKQPSISRTPKSSGDTWTDAASGAATTTKPTSGVYVQVNSAANTGTLTATPKVTSAGYGTTSNYGAIAGTATVGASASAATYVPITTVTLPTSASSSATSGYTSKATIGRSTSAQYINIPPGYNATGGYYTISAVATGTAGTPTATKGTVSNHAVIVTPSVTNTTGYISGGTKTGTGVSVSASELVSGTFTAFRSGTEDITNYATLSVPQGHASVTDMTVSAGGIIGLSADGEISVVINKAVNVYPTVTEGYVNQQDINYGVVRVQDTLTYQLDTIGAQTITPSTVNQTLAEYNFLTGDQTILGDANLIPPNIKQGVQIFNVTGTYSGGDEPEPVSMDDPVRFFDYDGTLLHSYSASDFQALSAMPSNPYHAGLIAQGWNWTLTDAKAQLTAMGSCDIGQMYVTSDGKTRIYVHMEEGKLHPYFGICPNGTVVVDWGDNNATSTLTGTSLTTVKVVDHTYVAGDYVITLTVSSGSFQFYGSSYTPYIFRKSNDTNNYIHRVYNACIKKIEIGSNATIGAYAFRYCCNMESITIPNSISSFGNYTFAECYSLKHVTVPSSVTQIPTYFLYYSTGLRSVSLPKNITILGNMSFQNCYTLMSIAVPSGVTSTGTYVFYGMYNLEKIKLPNGITTVNGNLFSNGYALKNVTLPQSATAINSNAFSSCYTLSSISIPSGVTTIQGYAFSSCYGLGEIHFKPTTPPTVAADTAFSNLPTDCKIYVPRGYLSVYTSANNYPSSSTYTYIEE